MPVTDLIPTIQTLSHTEKLLLLQVLVQEILKTEGISHIDLADLQPFSPSATESDALTLQERRAFLKQPLGDRQRLLAEQAEALQSHYAQNSDWQDLMAGDILDY